MSQPLLATKAASGAYRLTGVTLAVLGAVFFSVKSILIKLAYAYAVDAVTLIALRMIFPLPFFITVAIWSRSCRVRRWCCPACGSSAPRHRRRAETGCAAANFRRRGAELIS